MLGHYSSLIHGYRSESKRSRTLFALTSLLREERDAHDVPIQALTWRMELESVMSIRSAIRKAMIYPFIMST